MSEWTAMAGTSLFVVPDEERAHALAEALAQFGYPRVTARPTRPAPLDLDTVMEPTWTVTVLDEGPYPTDALGHRTYRAVVRQATALARQYGGFHRGGSQFGVSMVDHFDQDAPITLINPGRRPPVPELVEIIEPPDATLALTPDDWEETEIDLSGLDDVDWAALDHAHGSAEDIPDLIRGLAYEFEVWEEWTEIHSELFADNLLHQGTCYSATAPAMPFIAEMLASGGLPAVCRSYLYTDLVLAAGEWESSIVARMRLGGGPVAAAWTDEVYQAVGAFVPALLARWDFEPPANRYLLAFLAALYSRTEVADKVDAMADQFSDTKPGCYLRLAAALLRGADDEAAEMSAGIAAWEDYDDGYMDVPDVGAAMQGRITLTRGVLTTAYEESS
ncbi:hypothetical protein [Kibdelosporangium aridum]|nr:hypothetical protein [Kibdelosporangium aridum]